MYFAYFDDKLFYAPSMQDKKLRIVSPTITKTINKAGSFQFAMPFDNPRYNDYTKLRTIVTVKEDDDLIWKGRVLDTSRDFYNNKTFLCEGELAFLNDALVPPYDYSESGITVGNFLQMCFQHYLENCPVERKISLGTITAVNSSTTIYPKSESYVNVLETMLDKLVGKLGGYLSIRHQNGESYLDYLNTEINLTEQKIQFGINLLDLTEHIDASDVYTYLIPLGKRDDDGNRLTIESVNNGLGYIKSTTGEKLFGKIERCIIWDNIDNASTLKSLAENELESAIKENTTIELSSVDLKNLGVEVDHIQIGEYVTVISNPHNIHDNFLCTEITLDLQNPANNTYTIGGTVSSITESHANTVITVGNSMVTTDWLQAAIDNATAMMTGSKGGYKATEYDEHGRWLRDLYMNSPKKEDATYVMQINMNGIGFSREGFKGPYKNAWTIDGTLLGEFIKAGSITAQKLSVDYKESVTEEITAQFNVAKNMIKGKVSKGELSAELSLEPGQITITGNRLKIDSDRFKVNYDGTTEIIDGYFHAVGDNGSVVVTQDMIFFTDDESIDSGKISFRKDIRSMALGGYGIYESCAIGYWGDNTHFNPIIKVISGGNPPIELNGGFSVIGKEGITADIRYVRPDMGSSILHVWHGIIVGDERLS